MRHYHLEKVFLRYVDSGNPAVGLTVEDWVNDGNGDRLVFTSTSDGQGCAGYHVIGHTLIIRRGSYVFDLPIVVVERNSERYGFLLDIEGHQWPRELIELRRQFMEPAFRDLIGRAAKKTLDALASARTIECLMQRAHFSERPASDNPHIAAGALLCALSVSYSASRNRFLSQIESGQPAGSESRHGVLIFRAIKGILAWLESKQIESSGYFLRWKQSPSEDIPDPTMASRCNSANWKAEPSLDEYSGLVAGLAWVRHALPSLGVARRAAVIMQNIGAYLTSTKGFLLRPGVGDLTMRGPDIVVNAYPLSRVLFSVGGIGILDRSFEKRFPLTIDGPFRAMVKRSRQSLDKMLADERFKDAAKEYKDQVAPLEQMIASWDEAHEKWSLYGWLGSLGALVLTGPVGFLAMRVGLSAAEDLVDRTLDEVTDRWLWLKFGEALGPPASVDAGNYNVTIFDRFSLAASWAGDASIEEAFEKRSARNTSGDAWGWEVFGVALRIWFGKIGRFGVDDSVKITERVEKLKHCVEGNIRALIPADDEETPEASTQKTEGFLCGWALICQTLDLDPEIDWRDALGKLWYDEVLYPDDPIPVNSRSVAAVNYWGQELKVYLMNGDVLSFWKVPEAVIDVLLESQDFDSSFRELIDGKYSSEEQPGWYDPPDEGPVMVAVESSAISSIGYDDEQKKLMVRFKHGGSAAYRGVPRDVFLAFLGAESKGEFFNFGVRDKYK